MQLLKDKILAEGKVFEGNVLKVDSFLNHRIDVRFLCEIGKEFHRRFADAGVNKILTIEASGIGIACIAAQYFDVPVVFAKKSKSANMSADVYSAPVASFTRKKNYDIQVSREFLSADDRVLIIDDFLAEGSALIGLSQVVQQAGATLVGAGIVIEKSFQDGAARIKDMGIRLESLARVASMDVKDGVKFVD